MMVNVFHMQLVMSLIRRSTAATKAEPFDEPSSERTKRCYKR